MKILFFGDTVGRPGREALKKVLPKIKNKKKADLVIVNGENIAHGKGLTEDSLKELLGFDIDLVTSGDHVFDNKEIIALLEQEKHPLLRPLNFSYQAPGKGFGLINLGSKSILIVNLIGQVFMKRQFESPFRCIDELLQDYELGKNVNVILVDFHCEATSEKMAMGWHLDGRVSAVVGTHTHVQTSDERILPGGTAFISDAGMVGPRDSVIGLSKDTVLKEFLTQRRQSHRMAEGPVIVNGVFLEIDAKTGRAKKIERIKEIVSC